MYYEASFKTMRVLSHRRTYRVIQSTFGDEALGLTMGGTYWLTYGTLSATPNYVRQKADAMNITLSSKATHVDQYQSKLNGFVGGNVVPRDLSTMANTCYQRVKNQQTDRDGSGFFSGAKDFVGDVTGKLRGGDYTATDVLNSVQGINPDDLSKKQLEKIQQCVKKGDSSYSPPLVS